MLCWHKMMKSCRQKVLAMSWTEVDMRQQGQNIQIESV